MGESSVSPREEPPMNRQYRQGAVLLCAIDRTPPEAKPAPTNGDRVIVALGELTGHAHAFAAAEAQLFQEKSSRRSFWGIGGKLPLRCRPWSGTDLGAGPPSDCRRARPPARICPEVDRDRAVDQTG